MSWVYHHWCPPSRYCTYFSCCCYCSESEGDRVTPPQVASELTHIISYRLHYWGVHIKCKLLPPAYIVSYKGSLASNSRTLINLTHLFLIENYLVYPWGLVSKAVIFHMMLSPWTTKTIRYQKALGILKLARVDVSLRLPYSCFDWPNPCCSTFPERDQ